MPHSLSLKIWLLLIGGLSWHAPGVHAQPAKGVLPKAAAFECRWAEGSITIDGKADEPAWKHAQVIDHFYVPWLEKPRPARTKTKARLLWDRDNLYFFAEMEDHDVYADIKEQDGMLWENDVFELFFKPADDKPAYYEFQVNAAGAVLDMLLARRGSGGYRRYKNDGKFHIDAKVRLDGTLNNWRDKDKGWTVEGKIPWKDFLRTGGRPTVGDKWKFTLCRYDYSVDFEGPDLSTCAPLSKSNFHYFEDYASLTFVGPAKRPVGIEKRIPLTTSKVVGFPDPLPPYQVTRVYPRLKMHQPITVAHQPGSDRLLFITADRPGETTKIRRIKDSPEATLEDSEVLLDFDYVAYDFTFHPNFLKNGYVYVGSNGPHSAPGKDRKTRVTRYTMSPRPPYTFDPKSEKLIIDWHSNGHNGGAVAFGHDGMLYVTSGDGTSDSDTNIVGQDMSTLLAKVLRIDVDNPDPGKAYSVPKNNPFVNLKGARPETWALGLRAPWRMTVDKKTGHLWVGQNGQDTWEHAFLVKKGDNYGWSVYEGSHPFYLNRKMGPGPHVKPTIEHPHSEFRSLTGGIVYYGEKFPELQGAYIYGDYSTGKIWAARHDGTKMLWHKELTTTRLQITGFGTDSKGEILIADYRNRNEGGFYTLTPTPKDLPPSTFPRTLSASGLFRSVKGHVVEPALIPYSVNAPFWSDGVYKERWMAIPGEKPTIEMRRKDGWSFPDQTVIVKSFAFEMEEGNPASRRWIETRFLTKQGEWYGYSYEWNEDQTEGTLVSAGGKDREFKIKVPRSKEHPDGYRVQVWHYPSRTECMVCHTRAANYVLGPSHVQMNREHDYHGVKDHQFRVLEHLGLVKLDWTGVARDELREEAKALGLEGKEIDKYVAKNTDARRERYRREAQTLPFPAARFPRLVDPYDKKQDITLRARSYLHANCAQCHQMSGGGNAAMELEFETPFEKMKTIDVPPLHHTFGIKDARLIAPGYPERSTLLYRLTHRGPGQMPPLSTRMVDREAVEMLTEWIRHLGANK